MRRMFSVAITVATAVVILTSCSLLTPVPSPTSSPTAKASPTPSPTPSATTSSDVLFTITAELVSPEGSRIRVTEVAFAPVDRTPDVVAVLSAAGCNTADSPDLDASNFVRVEVRTELLVGPAPGDEYLLNVSAIGSDPRSATGFTGDWRVYEAYCSPGVFSIPGIAEGYTSFSTPTGWIDAGWGADAGTDRPDLIRPVKRFTAEKCSIAMGPASAGVTLPEGWRSPDLEYGCFFGVTD